MISRIIERLRRESRDINVLVKAVCSIYKERTVIVFNQLNPGRRFCFSCLNQGYTVIPKIDTAICVLESLRSCRILYGISAFMGRENIVQVASDDSTLLFVDRFSSFRLWWNNDKQDEYIRCRESDSITVHNVFSTDIERRRDLTVGFPYFTQVKRESIQDSSTFSIRRVCYIGAIDGKSVDFGINDSDFIDATLSVMHAKDKVERFGDMSLEQLKNTFRFSVLRYLISVFGEDRIDIYGSAGEVLQQKRMLSVSPDNCGLVYAKYALALDLLSRVGSSARYERSVAIVNSGGNLLQPFTYDSYKTFGGEGSGACTFRSCDDLVRLVRSALVDPFQYSSRIDSSRYYPTSEDFVASLFVHL